MACCRRPRADARGGGLICSLVATAMVEALIWRYVCFRPKAAAQHFCAVTSTLSAMKPQRSRGVLLSVKLTFNLRPQGLTNASLISPCSGNLKSDGFRQTLAASSHTPAHTCVGFKNLSM